jgi:hypothetical protein
MIEKEFVPYEEALTLKELGFNEPCLASYFHADKRLGLYEYINHGEYTVLAPTYSQAFRFFRQKGYIVNIVCDAENVNHRYMFDIFYDIQLKYSGAYEVDTYEQTELACLEKLIELVKGGNK